MKEREEENAMIINVEYISPCHMAYIRQTGPYGPGNIQAMEHLKHWAKVNDLMNNHSVILGIAHDDPQITPPENCRYDVCILIPDGYLAVNTDIQQGDIAGGKYAVCPVNHTTEGVEQAWAEIFQQLSANDYQLDPTRPILERYAVALVKQHLCEICVPVI